MKRTWRLVAVAFLAVAGAGEVRAAEMSFAAGAYVIDMGVQPQTVGNGLKPYGLIYDLVINQKVPVYWAINPAKAKDGVDFAVGVTNYRGGPFVVSAEYVTPAVLGVINTWRAKGVVVVGPLGAGFTAPIHDFISSFPNAVLDLQNGDIAQDYYINAEVPIGSYRLGNPDDLTACDDIYTMPHADPQNWTDGWKTGLLNFVTNGGYFYASCHAVSAMEALLDIGNNGSREFRFLSTQGLVVWTAHDKGSPPYTYNPAAAADPVM